jgi:hypothetical protein
MPSIPAMVRARWSELFRNRPELNTAFAFESAADELVYIAGASLSVGLAVALFPEAGMLTSTIFLALGTATFILQRSTEPKVRNAQAKAFRQSAISLRPVQVITLALVFVGSIFATAEVSAVAITKELGQPNAASLVIGVYAVGSFVVGLILGGLNPRMPLPRQLRVAVTCACHHHPASTRGGHLSATACTCGFRQRHRYLSYFHHGFGVIERRVPESMLTEGVTWVMTGIGIGMALGAFVSGWVIDNFGPQNGFWVSVVAGAATVLTVSLGQRSLAGDRASSAAGLTARPAE